MVRPSDKKLKQLGFEEFDFEYYLQLGHQLVIYYTPHNKEWSLFFVDQEKAGKYVPLNIESINQLKNLIKSFK